MKEKAHYWFVPCISLFSSLFFLSIYRTDYHEAWTNLCFAFLFFIQYQSALDFNLYIAYTRAQTKVVEQTYECITELAFRLVPFIGKQAVVNILLRHGIEISKIWDDFDDHYKRRKKRLGIKDVPDWIRDLKEKLLAAVDAPQPAAEPAKFEGIQE